MARLVIDHNKVTDVEAFLKLCPFGALEAREGRIEANAACKLCKLCIKNGPPGAAFLLEEQETPKADKASWNGIAVYVDHNGGDIHPVTFELIGKARELAEKVHQPVFAVFLGSGITSKAKELLHYGVDEVYVYDHPALGRFRIEAYAGAFETFIKRVRPSSILVGATTVGRQLAPRVAARMRTGLTADCTVLDIRENTDLVQIRPAFGGNIMAQILTPNHRPQMATVRYKVMNAPERSEAESGRIISCAAPEECLQSAVEVLGVAPKPPEQYIEAADVLVAAGRGVKKPEDLSMLEELAELLGGQLACTRPMAECGWVEPKRQVGLSGRTVRPRLIITCGVSGAIQFVAGMQNADTIIAINKDEKAPIFKVAHYGLVGDLYEILPALIAKIKAERGIGA
ncbi:electron transfer flavoprotein subunit alpha/FixB family protein [Anaerotruncus rubiinfantis]|uniref:electron transfer flavoprotein subunit alpha/FixB family protein n=1 Tax=Anaerotruncus rubiinfantis TaxID=1720200 RepID=UPI00082A8D30|nr:electron transfer flavoprotein subunit alpha/FixB family protein [Anaerotruncus rubiinfantis]